MTPCENGGGLEYCAGVGNMMAALALPEHVDEPGVDLREHYERHAPWFFGFFEASEHVPEQRYAPNGAGRIVMPNRACERTGHTKALAPPMPSSDGARLFQTLRS